ncbi:MAG: flagella basal body P-ring formation protein FlgA [Desulfovibrionaceae bacterium CG1_02_65_16]|nr:MAG: flagella basal body P-ring formation protein FlgA [Desulfovibrionaceae bacterium CG1_02_65_16]
MTDNTFHRFSHAAKALLGFLAAVACVFALAIPAGAVEMHQGWWLQVKNAACARGPKVLLGDIAEPRGNMPPADWKVLAARPLWNAPDRHGRQTALSRERLLEMLRYYVEDIAGACALPPQIVVQRGGKVIDGMELNQRIVDFLTSRGPAFNGEVELKDPHGPDYIFLPGDHDRLEIQASGQLKPGRVNLMFEVTSMDGRAARRYAASAFVNVWRALPVPTRPLNRRDTLNVSYVQFKRRNLAYFPDAWDGTGGPWRMSKSVGANQVIRLSDIEPVPVIAKGDKVNLVFNGENLRMQVKAEALSDGGVGQKIQVRNLQSKRKIMATVQDSETVLIR